MGRSLRRLTALAGISAALIFVGVSALAQGVHLGGDSQIAAIPSFQSSAAVVTNVRVGKHPDKTRIVLDISRPTDLRYEVSSDGKAIFLDLPNARWTASSFSARHSRGHVMDFRYAPDANFGGRLNVLTTGPVRLKKPFFVTPRGRQGHRIVIDLVSAPHNPRTGPGSLRQTNNFRAASFRPSDSSPKATQLVAGPSDIGAPGSGTVRTTPPPTGLAQEEMAQEEIAQAQRPPQMQNQPMNQEQRPSLLGFQNVYLKGGIGVHLVPEITNSGSGNENTMEFDPGYILNGGIGVDLENGFRVEGEINYGTTYVGKVTGTGNAATFGTTFTGGNMSILSFMGNLAYDFPNQSQFTPFIFGGLGMAGMYANDLQADNTVIADSNDYVFAMQGGVGVSFQLDELTTLEATYKYFETQDPEFGDQRGIPFETEYASHSFLFGGRLKF